MTSTISQLSSLLPRSPQSSFSWDNSNFNNNDWEDQKKQAEEDFNRTKNTVETGQKVIAGWIIAVIVISVLLFLGGAIFVAVIIVRIRRRSHRYQKAAEAGNATGYYDANTTYYNGPNNYYNAQIREEEMAPLSYTAADPYPPRQLPSSHDGGEDLTGNPQTTLEGNPVYQLDNKDVSGS